MSQRLSSAAFLCPHCGMTYPLVPALIGRPVRCRQCKNAFQVDPQGKVAPLVVHRPEGSEPPSGLQRALEETPPSGQAEHKPSTRFHSKRPMATQVVMEQLRHKMSEAEPLPAEDIGNAAESSGVFDQFVAPSAEKIEKPVLSTRFQQKKQRDSSGIAAAMRSSIIHVDRHTTDKRKAEKEREKASREPPKEIPRTSRQTITCPHCGTYYPFVESMPDEVQVCQECNGNFRVFDDTSTAPVIVHRPVQEGKPTSAKVAPKETPQAPAVPAQYKPGRTSRILRTRDLIADMSQGLKSLSKGIQTPPDAPQKNRKKTEDIQELLAAHSDKRETKVTKESQQSDLWPLVKWSAIAALLLIAFWITWRCCITTPVEKCFYAFGANTRSDSAHAAESIGNMLRRSWRTAAPVQPIIGIHTATLGKPWTISGPAFQALRSKLLGYRLHRPSGYWIRIQEFEPLETAWQGHLASGAAPETFRNTLNAIEGGFNGIEHISIIRDIRALGEDERVVRALQWIFSSDESGSLLREEILQAGPAPEALEILPFHGDQGFLFMASGGTLPLPYQGTLLRVKGSQGTKDWKVFSLVACEKGGRIDPNLTLE